MVAFVVDINEIPSHSNKMAWVLPPPSIRGFYPTSDWNAKQLKGVWTSTLNQKISKKYLVSRFEIINDSVLIFLLNCRPRSSSHLLLSKYCTISKSVSHQPKQLLFVKFPLPEQFRKTKTSVYIQFTLRFRPHFLNFSHQFYGLTLHMLFIH